jgi:hypothetical protein
MTANIDDTFMNFKGSLGFKSVFSFKDERKGPITF